MKKYLKCIVTLILISIILTGCANGQGLSTYNIKVQGAVFGGNGDDQISTTISFDPKWLTKDSNTKYNKDLASFSAVICDDVYYRVKDADKGIPNRILYEGEKVEEYDWTSFLKKVGFSEVKYVESYKEKEYSFDSNDSATLLLAHEVVDGKYDLYIAIVRGCFSAQEWMSIFDPGFDGENYEELTGEHPEWIDRKSYKGLDIAKNRALKFIDNFIDENNNPEYEDCILVTGHSRGGAIANMIGAEMENRKSIKSYTYTFNSPGVTNDENAKKFNSIFNIFDYNDYYTDPLPFRNERFYRYGTDLTMDISSKDEIKDEIAKLKGRDDFSSLTLDTKEEFSELFGKRFPNRASLYITRTVEETFENEEDAIKRAIGCLDLMGSEKGLGLTGLCYLNGNDNTKVFDSDDISKAIIKTDDNNYTVSLSYTDAAILFAYAKSLAYGEAAYNGTVELFRKDKEACEVIGLLMDNAVALSGGHLLLNSFVLSKYVK